METLLEMGMSCAAISRQYGISRHTCTLWRRMREWGMTGGRRYVALADDQLDDIIREIYSRHPHTGTQYYFTSMESRCDMRFAKCNLRYAKCNLENAICIFHKCVMQNASFLHKCDMQMQSAKCNLHFA